jgi:hypothetical protein
MVGVAQLVEHPVVVRDVAGSSPVAHPIIILKCIVLLVILGLNLSHEASIALTDESGQIIYAIEEERLSRSKGDNRFPIRALETLKFINFNEAISRVVIGNTNLQESRDAARFA